MLKVDQIKSFITFVINDEWDEQIITVGHIMLSQEPVLAA